MAFSSLLTGFTERDPSWFIMRYRLDAERVLLRVLRMIDVEYDTMTFEYRARHAGDVSYRHWLPGYMFVHIDLNADRWQQLLHAPGVIEMLGAPTPIRDDVFYDLRARCPREIEAYIRTIIPIGSHVEVLDGPMRSVRGVVSSVLGDDVLVEAIVFARLTRVRVDANNVMILRNDDA